MSDFDMIRRIDAMHACQVGPSDEWAMATKSGYNQAATDCAMNILRIEPVASPAPEQLMADPRVKSLVEAVTNRIKWGGHSDACKSIRWVNGECNCGQDQIISAIAPFRETEK